MTEVNFRPANRDDWERLFDWRNDPVTRASSRNTAPIKWEDHVRFCETNMASMSLLTSIAECDGEPVGVIRCDTMPAIELSWTVAPGQRGKGIGAAMVTKAAETCGSKTLLAWIKPDNAPSRKVAEAAGFEYFGTRKNLELWIKDAG